MADHRQETDLRFTECYKKCFETYSQWKDKKNDTDAREDLQESMHELRRVLARMEIEIATSQSNGRFAEALPVPPHRSKRDRGAVTEIPIESKANGRDQGADGGAKPEKPKGRLLRRRSESGDSAAAASSDE